MSREDENHQPEFDLKRLEKTPLRTVEWTQEVLGHRDVTTTYGWLRRNGVPVKSGMIHVEVFFDAWRPLQFDARAAVERLDGR